MNRFLPSLLSLLFVFCFLNSKAQKRTIISKTLLTISDSTPIVGVHIINLKTLQGVVSDAAGKFRVSASPTDTFRISSINFKTFKNTLHNSSDTIYLQQINYELEAHTVLPYKNFKEFKEAFLELELHDSTEKVNTSIYLSKEELRSYDGSSGISGGISAILSHFNKYMQDQKKYEKLMRDQDKEWAIVSKKFNATLIKQLTNLTKEKEIRIFMVYCDFTTHFIKYSYPSQLEEEIEFCYQEYITLSALK